LHVSIGGAVAFIDRLHDLNLLLEIPHGVLSLKLLHFTGSVLVKELVNGKETATDSDVNLIFFDLDIDSLATELVDTLLLTHEHDLQVLAIGVVVDVLGNLSVDRVVLYWNVDGNSSLEIDNVVAVSFDFGTQCVHLCLHVSLA